MKKVSVYVPILLSCILLTGCGGNETNDSDQKQEETFQTEDLIADNPQRYEKESKESQKQTESKNNSETKQSNSFEKNIPSLEVDNEIVLIATQQNKFSEMKIKRLPNETLLSFNFFEGKNLKNVILYGSWQDNTFAISSYLGKEQVTLTKVTLHPNQKQVTAIEKIGDQEIEWVFKQVKDKDTANKMQSGEIKWK